MKEFTSKETPYVEVEGTQYASLSKSIGAEKDRAFFRVSCDTVTNAAFNTSFYWGLNGQTAYSALVYPSIYDWYQEMEVARQNVQYHRFYPLDNRAALMTLDTVKYYAIRDDGTQVFPYGFEEIDRVQNGKATDVIMENKYALPVGYTYDAYINRDKFDTLSVLEKQEVLLQAAVLDTTPKSNNIVPALPEKTAIQCPAEISNLQGVVWRDGALQVKEEKGTITLSFQGIPNSETYLRIDSLDLTSGGSERRWDLSATAGAGTAYAAFAADAFLYTHGMKSQLLNLGYTEDGYTTCTITFPQKGNFKLNDLQIWCQPMEQYGSQIDALRAESLEDVKTNWRGLTGTISVSRDKILCIAVPYSEGWTVFVDGKKANLLPINTVFMGVELAAGDHQVELRYWMPGLTVGMSLTALGLISLVAVFAYDAYDHHGLVNRRLRSALKKGTQQERRS